MRFLTTVSVLILLGVGVQAASLLELSPSVRANGIAMISSVYMGDRSFSTNPAMPALGDQGRFTVSFTPIAERGMGQYISGLYPGIGGIGRSTVPEPVDLPDLSYSQYTVSGRLIERLSESAPVSVNLGYSLFRLGVEDFGSTGRIDTYQNENGVVIGGTEFTGLGVTSYDIHQVSAAVGRTGWVDISAGINVKRTVGSGEEATYVDWGIYGQIPVGEIMPDGNKPFRLGVGLMMRNLGSSKVLDPVGVGGNLLAQSTAVGVSLWKNLMLTDSIPATIRFLSEYHWPGSDTDGEAIKYGFEVDYDHTLQVRLGGIASERRATSTLTGVTSTYSDNYLTQGVSLSTLGLRKAFGMKPAGEDAEESLLSYLWHEVDLSVSYAHVKSDNRTNSDGNYLAVELIF